MTIKSSNRRAVDESDNDSVDGGISATVKESDYKTPSSGSQNTIGNSQRQGPPGQADLNLTKYFDRSQNIFEMISSKNKKETSNSQVANSFAVSSENRTSHEGTTLSKMPYQAIMRQQTAKTEKGMMKQIAIKSDG